MPHKKGFIHNLAVAQREAERIRAQRVRAETQAAKNAAQAQQAYLKAQDIQNRVAIAEQKQRYLELRTAQVDLQNAQLEQTVYQFNNLLSDALKTDAHIALQTLKQKPVIAAFNPGHLAVPLTPPMWDRYQPIEPTGMQKLKPGAKQKYQQELTYARQRFEYDFAAYNLAEKQRQIRLNEAYAEYTRQVQTIVTETDTQNQKIDEFQANLTAGFSEAVINYCTLILETSNYPQDFPQKARLAYQVESKQLVVEYSLPSLKIIPTVNTYKYIKSRDEITETIRPAIQYKQLYSLVVAQITLRTLHELFEADQLGHLDTIVFNGIVETVDESTGRPVKPCLVTLRTTRDTFENLNLSQVDPIKCLNGLNASVSKSPSELAPVRPVLEFDMVDPRFIRETDVLSELEMRPNLLELTPSEFESLITNLFQKMGLEARLTQASRDGGVDCVAYDPRPVLGGKVIIQAKRYKDTVGVSAVRDLYGTVHNEGASKGILVTTSGYGKAAFDFIQGKPLELLDGANLLYLLKEHAGIETRIEVPA